MKLVCTRDFIIINDVTFNKGEQYEYWTNFGGLNHLVRDNQGNVYPFDGDESRQHIELSEREYIWNYFTTIEKWREEQLNKIL